MNKHKSDIVVQLVLLAESHDLQAKMAMYGLETQTIESCAPITISTDSALRNAYSALGENSKLFEDRKLTQKTNWPPETTSRYAVNVQTLPLSGSFVRLSAPFHGQRRVLSRIR